MINVLEEKVEGGCQNFDVNVTLIYFHHQQ